MAVHKLIAHLCLLGLLVAVCPAFAQDSSSNEALLDISGPSPEYRAATVVTNLWLSGFAVTSVVFCILGAIVAIQWPNPRVLCYKTSYSDIPSSSARSCCSLYSLNLGFCVFWLLVFAIMVVARDLLRIIVCLSFAVGHTCVIVAFRMKFKKYGRPERPRNAETTVASSSSPATTLGPGQALGIPIYNIPMQTVVIGATSDGNANNSSAQQQSSSYWYDPACIPPPQQGMQDLQQSGAAAGPYPMGSHPNAHANGLVYPPQPPAYATYAGHLPPPPVPGTAVGIAVQEQPSAAGTAAAADPAGSAVPIAQPSVSQR